MTKTLALAIGCLALLGRVDVHAESPPPLQVGSKAFTESVILGDMATDVIRSAGVAAAHRRQLGGTRVLWDALLRGEIDVYPEYTGTIAQEILRAPEARDLGRLREELARRGVAMTRPLGFANTYAVGVRQEVAERWGLGTLSQLRGHPELRLGFSNEFMDRQDGWPGLRQRYALPQTNVRGLDHDLAYRALQAGSIDGTDLYSTDAEIAYYHLRVLKDDLAYFPDYQAVFVYRADLPRRAPRAVAALERLEGRISPQAMIDLNAQVKLRHVPEAQAAGAFLSQTLGITPTVQRSTWWRRVAARTREHLFLVALSLGAAIIAGIPLGIVAARRPQVGQVILGSVAAIYTIPSLALLVFMIPLLGIGAKPAILALFLYSLLPIIRNTHEGLREIPPPIRESALALGLPRWARLLWIELPLATGSILAGIQTAAVINVGTATLGALIGAGGYGQPILTGIRLDSIPLILEGAVPAAALALAVQGFFEIVRRLLVPRGLRLRESPV